MTVIARRIKATPARTALEAWGVIAELLAPEAESQARKELLEIAGVASSLIADEAMTSPIVVYGSGPRVRIYCLYDEDAILGEDAKETPLAFNATTGEWHMSLPCPEDDLQWVQEALKKKSSRITARDMTTDVEEEEADATEGRSQITVNREAFFRS
jgi:hypothetical protein